LKKHCGIFTDPTLTAIRNFLDFGKQLKYILVNPLLRDIYTI